MSFCHAYSRKYSRFVRLRLLGFKTPYFRNLPSKNNTQLFFSVVCQLSLAHFCERMNGNHILLIEDQQWSQRKWQLTNSRRRRVWNQTEGLDGIITKWCMASIRRKNTRWREMPYAYGNYILTCGEIPYQSFGLDRKKTVRKRSFFCVWSLIWQHNYITAFSMDFSLVIFSPR